MIKELSVSLSKMITWMRKVTLFLCLSLITLQMFSYGNRWKRTRYEIGGGIGITGFLGDLGGGAVAGEERGALDQYFADYDILTTRPAFTGFMRYRLSRSLTAKASISFGFVSGSDEFSENEARKSRNLNFSSFIFEQSLVFEYYIIKEKSSRRWSKRRRRRSVSFNPSLYLLGGIGGFLFNPTGTQDGVTMDLQPLGTEGQNVVGSPYSLYQACFPLGIGMTFNLNRKTSVGLEFAYRFTTTDYIDDASGSYFDNDKIIEAYGNNTFAGKFADPHIGGETFEEAGGFVGEYVKYKDYYTLEDEVPKESGSKWRGNSENDDMYLFMMFTMQYKLRTTRRGLPKF